ncbi:hypothetical protein Nepgr_019022 [Nepenthes gracilis]|uniref:NPH3 domain-containing protein n=1 Tax=Nepenthes gracilis TaxID=150966 RepID=A0AAD3SW66_NEPGR|nr:hypothetical protein Nepgr_019022 [Nepenthes gracilis]
MSLLLVIWEKGLEPETLASSAYVDSSSWTSPITELFTPNCPNFLCLPLTKQPEQTLAKSPSCELLLLKPVTIPDAFGMVDWEEVKVDTGQKIYFHLVQVPFIRIATTIFLYEVWRGRFYSACHHKLNNSNPQNNGSLCQQKKWVVHFYSYKCIVHLSEAPPCFHLWFSLPKLASGVDDVQFGYVRKYELTVVVKSSRNVVVFLLEKPSRTAHTIPDSVHGIFQRADGLVLEAMYLMAKALQQLTRLIELTSVCCVRIPKLFAVSWLYNGVQEASPSLSVKIEGAYILINHLEEAWEESGCIMWNLAANQYPESLIGANLVLEVLLVDLGIISLGIIGNLVCHEALITQIISTRGLMETIIDQVFLDATTCLGEPCRFLTLGLQGSERAAWANTLQSEHILNRALGNAEHALNPQLVGKSVGLLLAKVENQHKDASILLPILNNPGLLGLLVNLLSFKTGKWTRERIPEGFNCQYSALASEMSNAANSWSEAWLTGFGGVAPAAAWDSLKEIASVGINLSSVAPKNGKDRIGMKWGIGSRKNKHLVAEAAGISKERVAVALTSLLRAVVVLNKGEDLPPMAYGLFIAPQYVEVISSKACNEAAFPSQTLLREIIAAMTSRFLCPLLQCTIRLKASSSCKNGLGKCISAILEHVTAHDLLVLSFTYDEEDLFDLESVRRILSGLVAKERNVDVFNGGNFKEGYPAAMQQVAKTRDAYLGEIASYSDLSTSKEDVVYVSRLRGCGVPLIRKAITHKSQCGFVPQLASVEYVTVGWTRWDRKTTGKAVVESHPGPLLSNIEDKVLLKERAML